jgi:4-amino-4-deoxy-L-arabinose transferase-like glycosyltransferase
MTKKEKMLLYVAIAIGIVTIIPFLGLTEFNTKGEPREAVVALSMLQEHNWILPINNGGDIPYKPPFFQWCIALFSLPAGYVSEFTSRLPSAVALIVMAVVGCRFFAVRKNMTVAFIATMLTFTAFELHRAGDNCRVDMVLTAFIVCAMYLLYAWYEKGMRGLPWMAILCMSGATLTKGPVGIILPCMVMFFFMLLRGEKFWTTVGRFAAYAVIACILPALWYIAAYQQGGDKFLDLAMEENFGRFLGKMSYESHVEPFYYNFITLIAGWVPWTLLLLVGVLSDGTAKKALHARSCIGTFFSHFTERTRTFVVSLRRRDPLQLFVWLAFLLVLFFYCIPKSKRSVYIMPCYPFMAILIAEYIVHLVRRDIRSLKIFTGIVCFIGIALTAVFIAVKCGLVPDSIMKGKNADYNLLALHALEDVKLTFFHVLFIALPLIAALGCIICLLRRSSRSDGHLIAKMMFVLVFAVYLTLDGLILPTVMSTRSDRPLAETIRRDFPHDQMYSYLSTDMLHFFCTNFYLGDRIKQFEIARPSTGVLMIAAGEQKDFLNKYKAMYSFSFASKTQRRMTEMKDTIYFYKFRRCSTK